jgi:hypothetical protein
MALSFWLSGTSGDRQRGCGADEQQRSNECAGEANCELAAVDERESHFCHSLFEPPIGLAINIAGSVPIGKNRYLSVSAPRNYHEWPAANTKPWEISPTLQLVK